MVKGTAVGSRGDGLPYAIGRVISGPSRSKLLSSSRCPDTYRENWKSFSKRSRTVAEFASLRGQPGFLPPSVRHSTAIFQFPPHFSNRAPPMCLPFFRLPDTYAVFTKVAASGRYEDRTGKLGEFIWFPCTAKRLQLRDSIVSIPENNPRRVGAICSSTPGNSHPCAF